tara:strand:- start:968 stop:1186 length:219 start_codon:yes stop_codon:yes gene_type:complete
MSSDYRVICDRTGKKLNRSQCVKEWNGLLVWKDVVDPYPERLLAPNTREDLSVTETRTEGVDTFSVPSPNDL